MSPAKKKAQEESGQGTSSQEEQASVEPDLIQLPTYEEQARPVEEEDGEGEEEEEQQSEEAAFPGEEQEPVLHPALTPPTVMLPEGRLAMVEGDGVLRRVGHILANGSRFAGHPLVNFEAHRGILIQMQNAFDQRKAHPEEAQQTFLKYLEDDLRQGYGRIQGAMRPDEVEPALAHIKGLIEHVNKRRVDQGFTYQDGFEQVAAYLLRLSAPLDHF